MSKVVAFPVAEARRHSKRARLAAYLRELAESIDNDGVEIDPTAALVVLSGAAHHEVVCCGYGDDEAALREAAMVSGFVVRGDFVTLGGNRRNRGDYAPRPMSRPNIIDAAFPRKPSPPQPTATATREDGHANRD